MEAGEIEIFSIERIGLPDISPQLARESAFLGIVDLCRSRETRQGRERLSDSVSLPASPR